MTIEPSSDAVKDVVLSDAELSAHAHKQLYSFEDSCYIVSGDDLLASICSSAEITAERYHITANWENLLRIALWSSEKPLLFDVISLLRNSGAAEEELQPFKKAAIGDLLPWLYYSRKHDILRRLCIAAKAMAETKVNRKGLHIYCHLVSEDSRSIIASSL